VVSRLQEINPIITHQIDQAVLLRQPPRSCPGREVAQRLRLADALEGVAQDGFDQVKGAQCQFPVSIHPVL